MVRPSCSDTMDTKRGTWTEEEDAKILAYVSKHGAGNWTSAPKKAGLKRCGKSCRLRWTNYLRPDLNHNNFTPQEEELIIKLHAAIGSRWSIIAQQLPGRTDNDVKNHWNTKLKKKLTQMGIDHVTHKPFFQILSDFGNIGAFSSENCPKIKGPIKKDLKNITLTSASKTLGYPTTETEPKNNNINQSMDLYSQLQAIKSYTNTQKEKINSPDILGHPLPLSPSGSSSACSSSSASKHVGSSPDHVPFQWHEFILEEALFQKSTNEQENGFFGFSIDVPTKGNEMGVGHVEDRENNSSFVEKMLDEERDTFMDFAGLMEEPYWPNYLQN